MDKDVEKENVKKTKNCTLQQPLEKDDTNLIEKWAKDKPYKLSQHY